MGAPGFDDAPFAPDFPHLLRPKTVTFVYPYYENPIFLCEQIRGWLDYPREILERVRVIIVDDGSPFTPARVAVDHLAPNSAGLRLRLFRIEVDVRWNWLAARNIGAHHADDGWLMLTDMDHVCPFPVAEKLQTRAHDPHTIYRFSRHDYIASDPPSIVPIHPHPNSLFMTREMYWRIGGYDEALSGHYGTDGDYRRRCAATARVRTLREALIRCEYKGDSSTTTYKRKQPEDAGKKAIIARRRKGWRPRVLSFPYHEEEVA